MSVGIQNVGFDYFIKPCIPRRDRISVVLYNTHFPTDKQLTAHCTWHYMVDTITAISWHMVTLS